MTVLLKPAMVLTPDQELFGYSILFDTETGKILDLVSDTSNIIADEIITFDTPVIAVPGLINVHDHLLGTYWPKVARGPHLNWKFWDDALKSSRLYKERSNISKEDIYLLGAYKNLLSGVTTVMDHFPHSFNDSVIPTLPLNVPSEYCLAHEVSIYELSWWGDGVEVEYKKAKENNWPFVTHIEEGFDQESLRGIEQLKEFDALGENTVLVHGIGLNKKDIEEIAASQANMVWCPNSNMFMFDTTADVKAWIDAGINVSLGTDSPMSGSINLLSEMKFAYEVYESLYGRKISDKDLLKMITTNPAKALRINYKKGKIEKSFDADITLFTLDDFENPYSNIRNADIQQVQAVIIKGKVNLTKNKYKKIFEKISSENLTEAKISGEEILIKGDLNSLMRRIYFNVGFKKYLPFIPIEI